MTFTNTKKSAIPFDSSIHDIFTNDLVICTDQVKVARIKGEKDQVAWVIPSPIKIVDSGSISVAREVKRLYKANDRARYLRKILGR